jgi:DNA-binding transcriptional LysR family regulator
VGCFGDLPVGMSGHMLAADRWVLAVHPQSPLAGRGAVDAAARLHDQCVIEDCTQAPPRGARRLQAARVLACDRPGVALDLVRAGAGCAVLPASTVQRLAPDLPVLELGDLAPPRRVAIVWLEARRLPLLTDALLWSHTDTDADLLAVA